MKRPGGLFRNAKLLPDKCFGCKIPGALAVRMAAVAERLAMHDEKVNWTTVVLESFGKTCDTCEEYCDQLDKESGQAQ